MTKSKINIALDALLLLCFNAMLGTGLLLKYVLVPGYERFALYGQRVDLLFLGLNRPFWSKVHLILGFALVGILVLHLVLHWKMMLGMWTKLLEWRWPRRLATAVLLLSSLVLAAFPFMVAPRVREMGPHAGGMARPHSLANNASTTPVPFDRNRIGWLSPEERAAYWQGNRTNGGARPSWSGGPEVSSRGPGRPDFNQMHLPKPDGHRGGPHPLPEHVMAKYDLDGDGKLNEAEQAAAQAGKARRAQGLTARFDKDADGQLSAEESAAAWAWVEEDKRVTFLQFDKDGDGVLSDQEKEAIRNYDRTTSQGGAGKPGLPLAKQVKP